MSNRKGQLGKALTFLPVLLVLVVILTLYILLTSALSITKHVSSPMLVSFVSSDSLLMKTVEVSVSGTKRQTSVLGAYLLMKRGEIDAFAFERSLLPLVSAEHPCAVFAQGGKASPALGKGGNAWGNYLLRWNEGSPRGSNPGYVPLGLAKYQKSGALQPYSFFFKDERVYLESYLGRCLDLDG